MLNGATVDLSPFGQFLSHLGMGLCSSKDLVVYANVRTVITILAKRYVVRVITH